MLGALKSPTWIRAYSIKQCYQFLPGIKKHLINFFNSCRHHKYPYLNNITTVRFLPWTSVTTTIGGHRWLGWRSWWRSGLRQTRRTFGYVTRALWRWCHAVVQVLGNGRWCRARGRSTMLCVISNGHVPCTLAMYPRVSLVPGVLRKNTHSACCARARPTSSRPWQSNTYIICLTGVFWEKKNRFSLFFFFSAHQT